jgi:hypothetical protein|tara:strand:- start:634 stop:882 length:249 start_codon:yes stop_codon:yes gene_type:complete
MEGFELLDKAMNSSYKFLLGDDSIFESIPESDEMVFIPDPEISEEELAEELIEYFLDNQEYEKCANIRDVMKLKKVIYKLYE